MLTKPCSQAIGFSFKGRFLNTKLLWFVPPGFLLNFVTTFCKGGGGEIQIYSGFKFKDLNSTTKDHPRWWLHVRTNCNIRGLFSSFPLLKSLVNNHHPSTWSNIHDNYNDNFGECNIKHNLARRCFILEMIAILRVLFPSFPLNPLLRTTIQHTSPSLDRCHRCHHFSLHHME